MAVECYADKLVDSQATDASVKAASMLGVFGDAKVAAGIVERLPRISTTEGRQTALAALDHLVRDDGKAIADSLEKLAQDESFSKERVALRRAALRLRAR